eukprot:CAMPEP_0195145118 /NCGR_PEP_ID=MMETSP0448-20130528/169301_1 /TAXON_ID=66468 /ORGANISM="Heterocapsa triquestra, Strain CCMP 448" /LENGTH=95 /DNA_ID=CAMNT_0040183617 /DNA_START=23 /DNA_END=305 /DNA_ORIENTATION=-
MPLRSFWSSSPLEATSCPATPSLSTSLDGGVAAARVLVVGVRPPPQHEPQEADHARAQDGQLEDTTLQEVQSLPLEVIHLHKQVVHVLDLLDAPA